MNGRQYVYVIPCSGEKAATSAAAARDLYRGTMFRNTLAATLANAAKDEEAGATTRVLILSAKHGLLDLDAIVGTYECRITDPDSITADDLAWQAVTMGLTKEEVEVYSLLPRAYYQRLDAALRRFDAFAHDVYEATGGIGEQRRVNRCITR